jgi:hypothetical protein
MTKWFGFNVGIIHITSYPECLYWLIRSLSYEYTRDPFNVILGYECMNLYPHASYMMFYYGTYIQPLPCYWNTNLYEKTACMTELFILFVYYVINEFI